MCNYKDSCPMQFQSKIEEEPNLPKGYYSDDELSDSEIIERHKKYEYWFQVIETRKQCLRICLKKESGLDDEAIEKLIICIFNCSFLNIPCILSCAGIVVTDRVVRALRKCIRRCW